MNLDEKFMPLENLLGKTDADEITVQLFKSSRRVKKDRKGKYIEWALAPCRNGVIYTKIYQ
jgi:hypothetical protein